MKLADSLSQFLVISSGLDISDNLEQLILYFGRQRMGMQFVKSRCTVERKMDHIIISSAC